jgi:hypothetical protein
VKNLLVKNHFKHIWYGWQLINLFHWSFLQVKVSCSYVFWFDLMEVMFCKYEYCYEPKHHHKDPNHMRSIKHDCLTHFSINKLYTWPNVVEITFYHWTHIRANGDLAHGACDLRFTSHMSMYVSFVPHIEGFYMDPIKVGVHCETNIWQT